MYLLRTAGVILCILICTNVQAQKSKRAYSLSGTVRNEEQKPLAGATIYISDIRRGAIADSKGNYSIQNIPAGTFLVTVDFTGYRSDAVDLSFHQDVEHDFELEIAVTEEAEIVIVSSLRAGTLKRNPIPIVTVSREFLTQNLSSNLVNAIANVPGVSAVTTGPNVSKPFIRGLGYNRVLTLFDGVRQEGQQWGDEHGVEINENLVDKVEVIKGPASLLYGSDAIGGLINFIPPQPPGQEKTRGTLSLGYGSNNNLLEGAANVQGHTGGFRWGAIGAHKMAANYRNKIDGRVYNTGFKESSLLLQGGINKRWGYSRTVLTYYNALQEIPDGLRDSATRRFMKETEDGDFVIVPASEMKQYAISDVYQHIRHLRAYNISNFTVGRGRVGTQIGFQNNVRKEFEEPGSDEAALFLDLNTLTYDFKYFLPRINRISITAGVNGMYQTNNSNKGDEFLIPNYNQFDLGPFLYAKYEQGKSEWAGGIRYDMRSFKNDALYVIESNGKEVPVYGIDTLNAERIFANYRNTFSGFTGSIGFTHRFNREWNIKINAARGYRAPNISEISSNGIHAGSKIYQLGNTDFKPEFNFQQDIEVAFNSEHVTINASAFNNRIQNYIFNQKLLTPSGADSVIVPGFETFKFTSSRAHLYGGEFLVDIHPHPLDWLHFENSIAMVMARNIGSNGQTIADDEKYLPSIPPIHGKSELRANIEKWKQFSELYLKVQLLFFATQNRAFTAYGTETISPGYQLVNIGLGGDVRNRNGNTVASLNVMVSNVFDKAYQPHLSRLKYFEEYPGDPRGHHGIYSMGRNMSLRLTIPFNL